MLVVTDFGQRIQTPWREQLSSRRVQALNASTRVAAVSTERDSHRRPSLPPYQQPHQQSHQPPHQHLRQQNLHQQQADQYTQNETVTKARQAVKEAQQIMSSRVICINQNQNTQIAQQLMQKHNFHHLPVIDQQAQLQGLISDRDLLAQGTSNSTLVTSIMQTKVLCAARNTPIREIAEAMLEYRIGALPLIDSNNKVEGIITRHDILQAVVQQGPIELWT